MHHPTRRATSALVALLALFSVAACSTPAPAPTVTVTVTAAPPAPEPTPTSTGEAPMAYAADAACAIGEAGINIIVAGGKAAQAIAALIAQTVGDADIRRLAERLRDGADTAEIRDELGERLRVLCAD